VYGLPAERVWVSVYEDDDEALALWRDVVGVHPSRIRKMGAADNFWASGPTGGQRTGLMHGRGVCEDLSALQRRFN
jgi:alanyl-tRNA synthetase